MAKPVATKRSQQGGRTAMPRSGNRPESPDSPTQPRGQNVRFGTGKGSGRTLAIIAFAIGISVGVVTYAVNRVAVGDPTAQATVILDERQVRWPFYGAAFEQAESILGSTETLQAARSTLQNPADAIEISLEPSTDQSVLVITATATGEEAALGLAESAAAELVSASALSRQTVEAEVVDRLASEIEELTAEQETLRQLLSSVDNDADSLVASKDLEHSAERLNLKKTALQDATENLDNTGPLFVAVGKPILRGQVTQSVLASISAGAGSTVLVLLAFSLLATTSDEN